MQCWAKFLTEIFFNAIWKADSSSLCERQRIKNSTVTPGKEGRDEKEKYYETIVLKTNDIPDGKDRQWKRLGNLETELVISENLIEDSANIAGKALFKQRKLNLFLMSCYI